MGIAPYGERRINGGRLIIGNRIRRCRQQKAWTQETLAEALCISHQTVSKWENGLLAPDVSILVKLSSLFQVSMDYLCGTEMGEQETIINNIIERIKLDDCRDYDTLKKLNEQLNRELEKFPLNDMLLNHQLHLLRNMHDSKGFFRKSRSPLPQERKY